MTLHTQPTAKTTPDPLMDILINVILPSLTLEFLSEPQRLGPTKALLLSILLPCFFILHSWIKGHTLNRFSLLGLATLLITGGLGLLQLSVFWFALKESFFPIILGLLFPFTAKNKKPLFTELILQPNLFDLSSISKKIKEFNLEHQYQKLISKYSWFLALITFGSAALNFTLAYWLLNGKTSGSTEFTQALGRLTWTGYLIIGIPLLLGMMLIVFQFAKSLGKLTQLGPHVFQPKKSKYS
jgi:hypothetical protein